MIFYQNFRVQLTTTCWFQFNGTWSIVEHAEQNVFCVPRLRVIIKTLVTSSSNVIFYCVVVFMGCMLPHALTCGIPPLVSPSQLPLGGSELESAGIVSRIVLCNDPSVLWSLSHIQEE